MLGEGDLPMNQPVGREIYVRHVSEAFSRQSKILQSSSGSVNPVSFPYFFVKCRDLHMMNLMAGDESGFCP